MADMKNSTRSDVRSRRSEPNFILAWMCLLVGVNQLGFGSVVPSLPLYAKSFDVTGSAIGMAVGIYGLARFIVALPAGRLADDLGRRPSLAIGGVISGLGNLWCAWATNYLEFLIARFVAGAGASIIVTVGLIVSADISVPERRGWMLAVFMGCFIFAVGVGPFPGGILAEAYGLSAPFLAFGVANILATCVAWFAIVETRGYQQGDGTNVFVSTNFGNQVRQLCHRLGFLLLVCLLGFANAASRTGGLFAIVPVFASVQIGLSVSQIGFALMIGSVSGLLASYPTGSLADHYGRKAIIVPATILAGASMIAFAISENYTAFVFASIIWGVASTAGGAVPTAYAADVAPAGMNAAAIASYRAVGDAGYVIGPLALGLIVDLYGSECALVVAATVMGVVGVLFAIMAPETVEHGTRAK
ncbi:MAG: MFS transporter [Hyphomicrobiaceae bacterium]